MTSSQLLTSSVRRELWEATAKDKDGLIVAMSRFQDKLRKDDPALRQVDLQTCQWPQVMEEFKGALKYYEVEKRKGVGGAMLTCLRKLGEHSDAFSRWIDLLPNGDYGSPICGILTSSVTIRELAWTALTSSAGAFKLIISVSHPKSDSQNASNVGNPILRQQLA